MLKTMFKKCMRVKAYFIPFNVVLVMIYIGEMSIPYVFSQFIDGITYGSGEAIIRRSIIIIGGMTIILLIASYMKGILCELVRSKVSNAFLNEVDEKLEALPLNKVAQHNPAYLNSRIFNDTFTTVGFMIDNLVVGIIMMMSTLILFFMIAMINPLMLCVVVVALIINVVGILMMNKRVYKLGYAYRDLNSLYVSANNDRLASIKETKIHAWHTISGEQVEQAFSDLLKTGIAFNKVLGVLNNIGNLTKNITLILTILIGGKLLIEKRMTIGELMVITTYTNMCLANSEFFLKLGQSFQQAKVCFLRLQEFMGEEDEKNGEVKIEKVEAITIKNLTFAYPEAPPLYRDFNASFIKGKIYCLKGKNGDGKSTFIDLLLGLNEGFEGNICFNGIDISEIDMRKLRQEKISVILQEPSMQRVSIKENIVRGIQTYNGPLLEKLCNVFNMNQVMAKEDALSVSGGEKQKVSVIRGLLKQSDVLILDEPVSAMDSGGIEVLKQEIIAQKADKIIIFISHNEELFDLVDEFVELSKRTTE